MTKNIIMALMTCCFFQACQSESEFDSKAFFKANCSICHENTEMQRGPNIFGLNEKYIFKQLEKYEQGIRGKNIINKSEHLMGSISNLLPKGSKRVSLSKWISEQKAPKFIYNLKGSYEGVVDKAQACLNCHQEGQELINPNLLSLEPWYLLDQLRKFKRNWRGYHKDDHEGKVMGQAIAHLDDKELKKITLYLQALMVKK